MLGITLLAAGHKTTATSSSHIFALLETRERWKELVAEPELVPAASRKLLRYAPLSPASDNTRSPRPIESGHSEEGDAVLVTTRLANATRVFPIRTTWLPPPRPTAVAIGCCRAATAARTQQFLDRGRHQFRLRDQFLPPLPRLQQGEMWLLNWLASCGRRRAA